MKIRLTAEAGDRTKPKRSIRRTSRTRGAQRRNKTQNQLTHFLKLLRHYSLYTLTQHFLLYPVRNLRGFYRSKPIDIIVLWPGARAAARSSCRHFPKEAGGTRQRHAFSVTLFVALEPTHGGSSAPTSSNDAAHISPMRRSQLWSTLADE